MNQYLYNLTVWSSLQEANKSSLNNSLLTYFECLWFGSTSFKKFNWWSYNLIEPSPNPIAMNYSLTSKAVIIS